MKIPAFVILLFISSNIYSQNKRDYGQFGPVFYTAKGGSLIGGNIGVNFSRGVGGVGGSIEILSQKRNIVVPVYADCRFYFSKKKTTPFVTVQPGYNFRNTTTSRYFKEKGGAFLAAGLGLFSLNKRPGVSFQLKYSIMGTKTLVVDNAGTTKTQVTGNEKYLGVALFLLL